MITILVILTIVILIMTMALAFWAAVLDRDPLALAVGVFMIVLAIVLVGVLKSENDRLDCETMVETMVTVGDVEICMPTSDAVDLVEVYQGD